MTDLSSIARTAAVAVLAVSAAGCATAHARHHAAPPRAPSASPAATLSTSEQAFVTALVMRLSAEGEGTTETDAQVAAAGEAVCQALRSGTPASQAVGSSRGDRLLARLAVRYLCPAYLPRVLIRFSGQGIAGSRPFTVPTGLVTVSYSYDCSATGTGNFIADLVAPGDDQGIANVIGAGGHAVTTVYPALPGTAYHVAVNSECSWSVVVRSG